jgi:hypothetical protein
MLYVLTVLKYGASNHLNIDVKERQLQVERKVIVISQIPLRHLMKRAEVESGIVRASCCRVAEEFTIYNVLLGRSLSVESFFALIVYSPLCSKLIDIQNQIDINVMLKLENLQRSRR